MIPLLGLFALTVTAQWIGSYVSLAIASITLFVLVKGAGLKWLNRNLQDLREGQRDIKKELVPNSGSSLKDQMNRIEIIVKAVQEEQVKVKSRLDGLEHNRPFWRR